MVKKELWRVERVAYNSDTIRLCVGDETIIINPCKEEIWYMDSASSVHLMLTDMREEYVEGLAVTIEQMYLKNKMLPCDIRVYYPDENLVNKLEKFGTAIDKYTFYINLWDDMNVSGCRKEMEYIFEKNQGKYESYSLEFVMKNEFNIYFSGNCPAVKQRVVGTRIYDRIYQWCGSIATEDYPGYDSVAQVFTSKCKRKNVWLVTKGTEFDSQTAESDGFMIVDNI